MSSNYYPKGNVIRCVGKFFADSEPVDPGTVYFSVKNPLGTITTYTYPQDFSIIRDSQGIYHVDVDGNMSGAWYYRFWSTAFEAAKETQFIVSKSQF